MMVELWSASMLFIMYQKNFLGKMQQQKRQQVMNWTWNLKVVKYIS